MDGIPRLYGRVGNPRPAQSRFLRSGQIPGAAGSVSQSRRASSVEARSRKRAPTSICEMACWLTPISLATSACFFRRRYLRTAAARAGQGAGRPPPTMPTRELIGFGRVSLAPGATEEEEHTQTGGEHHHRLAVGVEASIAREISPSDAALQAYLAVGRPRLSQIFNGLHKAGILSVRKKGRTRLFRISDQAKAHFSDEHMEA